MREAINVENEMSIRKMNVTTTAKRVSRALERGVTLVEILIVLAIVGLIAGGIAVFAIPKFQQAQKDSTKNSAIALHQAAELWRTSHTSECPTAERLKAEKEIASTAKITDAWDSPYKIVCEEDSLTVISFGPDKKEGTQDDIRVPEQQPQGH
jgi:general secretion pathway protein G